jgi:hypothetical protein
LPLGRPKEERPPRERAPTRKKIPPRDTPATANAVAKKILVVESTVWVSTPKMYATSRAGITRIRFAAKNCSRARPSECPKGVYRVHLRAKRGNFKRV